jgi:protein phosphatase
MPAGAAAASTIGSAPGEADTQTGDTEPPASAAATGPSRTGARAGDRGKADWSAAQGAEGSIPPTTGATVVLPTEPGTTSKPEMTTGETGTVAEEPDITADKADTSAVNVSFLPLAAIVAALARLRRIPVRRPLLTSALAVLAILVVGGIFAGWRYTQARYYVGEEAGHVAIFRGINQNLAGLNLSSVYQRTQIPQAAVPFTDQQLIRSNFSAGSLGHAQRILGHIRSDYQACVTAYTALKAYQAEVNTYTTALNAYKKKYGVTTPVKSKAGKVIATPPPKPTGTQPTIPEGCPAPSAASGTGAAP